MNKPLILDDIPKRKIKSKYVTLVIVGGLALLGLAALVTFLVINKRSVTSSDLGRK